MLVLHWYVEQDQKPIELIARLSLTLIGYWVRLLFGFPLRPVWFIVGERGCVSSSYKDL